MKRTWANRQSGLTLIEILTVLMLASIVLSVVAVSAGGMLGSRITKTVNKLSAMARYTYDLASLHGKMHALVIDIEGGQYYVEEVEPPKECSQSLDEEEEKERQEQEDEKAAATKPTGKEIKDPRIRKEKLPQGVRFAAVLTKHNRKPVEEGKESIHFFPDGTAEKAFVWVTDGDDVFTVEITSLLGTGIVYKEELDARELEKR